MPSLHLFLPISSYEVASTVAGNIDPSDAAAPISIGALGIFLIGYIYKVGKDSRDASDKAIKVSQDSADKAAEEYRRTKQEQKEFYEDQLARAESEAVRKLEEKERDIEHIRGLYKESAEMFLEPLKKELEDTRKQLRDFRKRIASQENEIGELKYFKKRYKEALDFINELIAKLHSASMEVPEIPETLRRPIERNAYDNSTAEGKKAADAAIDDIIFTETMTQEIPTVEKKND